MAARAWIELYLDGQLSPSEVAHFQYVLTRQPDLRPLLRDSRSFHVFLCVALQRVRVPHGLEERIRARLTGVASCPVIADCEPTGALTRDRHEVRFLRFIKHLRKTLSRQSGR